MPSFRLVGSAYLAEIALGLQVGSGAIGSNYSTASLTEVSTGWGVSINLKSTGRVFWLLNALVSHSVATDQVVLGIWRTSGSIPAAGNSPTGTLNLRAQVVSPLAGTGTPVEITNIDGPGVPLGNWNYYATLYAAQAGTATLYSSSLTTLVAIEV